MVCLETCHQVNRGDIPVAGQECLSGANQPSDGDIAGNDSYVWRRYISTKNLNVWSSHNRFQNYRKIFIISHT